MPNIHFFPGNALTSLIKKEKLSCDTIKQCFKQIKNLPNNTNYDFFTDFFIYLDEHEIKNHPFKMNDIIIAGSRGGLLAHQFIQYHHITNPKIVAFEALGLDHYGQHVWHFISEKGEHFSHKTHINYYWDDKSIGHNSYMLHPDTDKIIEKKSPAIKITEHMTEKGSKEYFYLFNQVKILHSQTGIQKTLNNILMRCNENGELIIPENHYDQVCLNMDVIIYAAFARAHDSIGDMSDGFTVHQLLHAKSF